MDAVVIEMIPPLVKRQWIEFARKLETRLVGNAATVDEILQGKAEDMSTEEAAPAHGPPRPTTGTKNKRSKP